ncbi:type IX secretion system sortase PorU [Algoriphagus sediminis]|uniref:Type IX secretion system sortase PorU n=1 Tax=Algoriphagus sediminis TaxID=3057113 RepID=A0ABT7Y8M7_9BACT|nr:type IX secretion system sortase PorU [Algoriphagus sediminis]MDN3202847.1 type IX secretion system sortase PorU [Algoriphagus sediminis]
MILNWRSWVFGLFLMVLSPILLAQSSFYKFAISKEGIYKISAAQLESLSINPEEVGVFGYPGQLPQTFQSEDLELHQIPVHFENGDIFVFLSGPDRRVWNGEYWEEVNHLGVDELSFLIGKTEEPKRISTLQTPSGNNGISSILYQFNTYREERTNLLNSGRVWYGQAIGSGNSQAIRFGLSSSEPAPWIISGSFMAQSLANSQIRISANGQLISELEFEAIPDAIYGVKGESIFINETFEPTNNQVDEVEVSYSASASNSSGYVEFITLGMPQSSINLSSGVWHRQSSELFEISLSEGLEIWNVERFFEPESLLIEEIGTTNFMKLVVFDSSSAPEITDFETADLSLRSSASNAGLLIISPSELWNSAVRLQAHKNSMGLSTELVSLQQVIDAYAYGNLDVNGIRNFIASRFGNGSLKNVLLFGKGTFDTKGILGGRPNLIPTYSSRESLNPLTTFSSDDFFGLINPGQGNWEENREGDELMQIGVGRIPVINESEAKVMVDKIIEYELNPLPGDWKRTVAFFADDADNNIHARDAESHSQYLFENHQGYFQRKLYLDRYEQISTGSGQESPAAKEALLETLERGTLLLNYIGHGNETTLTAEEVFQVEDIRDWPAQERLALWVTATCEFGRHDSPFIRSAAEELMIIPDKGAIGLLTTGRPVFSSVNFRLNEAFVQEVFKRDNGESRTLGEIFKNTKNQSLNGALNRNFALLGDPSMKLASPELEIEISSLKSVSKQTEVDTLSAFQEIELKGQVIDPLSGAKLSSFDGEYLIDIRDKPGTSTTLGDESNPFDFKEEKVSLFRGKGKISAGEFTSTFLISSNIDYEYGKGALRILGTEEDGVSEAFGGRTPIIGGSGEKPNDKEGPQIQAYFNEKSENLSFNSKQIILDLTLEDISGINVSGLNPGQNIEVQVNNNPPQNLNSLFLSSDGNFKKGSLTTTINNLNEGLNKITIRAWDNVGNSSSLERIIEVVGSNFIQILSHKVYPNPSSIESNFEISHNRPDENLVLSLSVYNMEGRILFSDIQRLVGVSPVIRGIKWIFLQEQSKYPAKGTYIYKLSLISELDGSEASVSGKLIIE